jgi:SAM-dependent methyltransferase
MDTLYVLDGATLSPGSPRYPACMTSFDELVAEGESAPVDGWDFSWFEGRATEVRPSWGFAEALGARMSRVESALDLETGGGEVLATIPKAPRVLVATESWPPNIAIARERLATLGATVVEVGDADPLPFDSATFELVSTRHPNVVDWPEVARVLKPGGRFFGQLIGNATNRLLYEYLMGPQDAGSARLASVEAAAAETAGLHAIDVRHESTRVEFYDVGAIVHFLRKVVWTVPDFSVDRYRERLRALHDDIQRDGMFVSYSERVLIEAVKP